MTHPGSRTPLLSRFRETRSELCGNLKPRSFRRRRRSRESYRFLRRDGARPDEDGEEVLPPGDRALLLSDDARLPHNKKMLEEVAIIPSKRLRYKIAGFSTHLMRRIQRGPVRGISLKLQEEERARPMDFVPDESAIKVENIVVDQQTFDMLATLGMAELPGVEKQADAPAPLSYPSRPGVGYGRRL